MGQRLTGRGKVRNTGQVFWLLLIGLELPKYMVQVLVPLKGATNIYVEGENRQIMKIWFSSSSDEQFFSEEGQYQEMDFFFKLGYNSHIIKLFFKNIQFSEFKHIQKVVWLTCHYSQKDILYTKVVTLHSFFP